MAVELSSLALNTMLSHGPDAPVHDEDDVVSNAGGSLVALECTMVKQEVWLAFPGGCRRQAVVEEVATVFQGVGATRAERLFQLEAILLQQVGACA